MNRIKCVKAREILDSRGNPTVQAEVFLDNGISAEAAVPSGASTGQKEALELRDGNVRFKDKKMQKLAKKRFLGRGVLAAVANVNGKISRAVSGIGILNQGEIDAVMVELDGSSDKSKLGANAILAVSLACARAAAKSLNIELFRYLGGINANVLPVPMMNVLNAGVHSDAPVDIQEFMIVPKGFGSFPESLRASVEVFQTLKNVLKKSGYSTAVGDEGGFAPNIRGTEDALDIISNAVCDAGYILGKEFFFALDVASSEFYDEKSGEYVFKKSGGMRLNSAQMVEYLAALKRRYPIISIEDGCAENDWKGWQILTEKLGKNTQLVGDDLMVTNMRYIKEAVEKRVANAVLIKPNQVGTLSETMEAVSYAKQNGYKCIISHRSGETADTFIADLAVGVNSGQIKTGSLSRCDRTAKYNRLLKIQELLGNSAVFG